ncbi:hypothetical protein B0H13DRAFT_2319734 [Mycena leptocephala]|nr:hypothetical protein B0H13DRAFT_2319734 [Mycena leptocephala]
MPRQKPGNKGDFHGHHDFLIAKLAGYMEALRNGKTRLFWPGFFKRYWEKFNWQLSLQEEPVEGTIWPDDNSLSADDLYKKSKAQLFLKAKIKTWYNHHCSTMGITNNLYTPWLACLHRPDEPSLKQTTDYQFYMRHEDYKKAVDDEFKIRHWDEPWHKHLVLCCKIAREMFDQEPEAVKECIREEAWEEHKEKKQQWIDAEEGLLSANEEDKKEVHLRFSAVVSPLLKALQAYTGYHISLIGGRLVGDKVDLVSVHVGMTKTKDGMENRKDFTHFGAIHAEPSTDMLMPAPDSNPERLDENPAAVTGIPLDPIPTAATSAPPAPIPTSNPFVNRDKMPMQLLPPNTSLPLPSSVLAAPRTSTLPLPMRQATPPAPGSIEERMATLAVLESPLQRELEAMTPDQGEARVRELGSLNTMTLQWENNMAHN